MSTLKTHNLQSPDAGSVNIAMTPNAGMIVTGISTFTGDVILNSNLGFGGIPKTQNTFDVIEFGKTGLLGSQTGARTVEMTSNAYYNSGWKYKENDVATQYYQYAGYHAFGTASSGSADGAVSFNEVFKINADGKAQFAGAADVWLTLGSQGTAGSNTANWIRGYNSDLMFNSTNQHVWEISGSNKMILRSDGNLYLRNATANYLVLGTNGSATSSGISNNMNWIRGNGALVQYNSSGGFHSWEVSGSEKVRITAGGQVNIGGDYSQTSRALAVNGSVLFKTGEADIWMESTGPNGVWRILGSTGGNTHRFRIYDNTNSADRFNIDSNGYIYEPAMPFGVLHGTTGWQYNSNGNGHYLLGNTNSSSGGGNGSDKQLNLGWTTSGGNGATNNNFVPNNGIWTAPIAGYYVFGLKLYGLMNGNDYIQIKPCLNGTHLSETIYGYLQGNGYYMEGINETVRYYMNANDTFSWNAYGPNNAWRIYGAHCECSGYLVRGA